MITLHIITKSQDQAMVIAEELLKRNFIMKVLIFENTLLLEQNGNNTKSASSTLLVAIGKASNCSNATDLIVQLFPKDEPLFYVLPIITTNINRE